MFEKLSFLEEQFEELAKKISDPGGHRRPGDLA